jgi:hypothetical protein
LVLFVRIGTFQWVTANPNKKIFSRVTLCLKCHNRIPRPLLGVGRRRGAVRFGSEKIIAQISDFRKQFAICLSEDARADSQAAFRKAATQGR